MNAEKNAIILKALSNEGPMTADEFVTNRGWYVNSWAPSFTQLRKAGLVKRNGQRRKTVHGSDAFVIEITQAGRAELARELVAA